MTVGGGVRLRLADLAARLGAEVRGDGERWIAGVRNLADAGPEHLSLFSHPFYRDQVAGSRAGALLVPRRRDRLVAAVADRDLVLVDDVAATLIELIPLFHPPRRPAPGIHPTAICGAGSSVDPSAHVGPYAVVGEGTVVEAEVVIEALAVVGSGCRIGRGARLHPHAVVYDGCEVGERGELHAGAVIGADGFGYASRGVEHRKVPQVGRVVLEADVEVGVNSAVDRGALGETRVGAGSKIDNLVQVGHNCLIGRGVLLSGQCGLSGSTIVGEGTVMGGRSGASGHLEIGAGTMVAGVSTVMQTVPPGSRLAGTPAIDLARWRRQSALLGRLDELVRRVRALERRLGTDDGGDEGGGEQA